MMGLNNRYIVPPQAHVSQSSINTWTVVELIGEMLIVLVLRQLSYVFQSTHNDKRIKYEVLEALPRLTIRIFLHPSAHRIRSPTAQNFTRDFTVNLKSTTSHTDN